MDETTREHLKKRLIAKEGLRLKLYRDSVGKWTIGVGRNIADRGISPMEAEMMLNNDIDDALTDALSIFGLAFNTWEPARQAAICDMLFNLGKVRFQGFSNMISAIRHGNWADAAKHAKQSVWHTQVKGRAVEIEKMLETGKWADS
jgi:lysozyme